MKAELTAAALERLRPGYPSAFTKRSSIQNTPFIPRGHSTASRPAPVRGITYLPSRSRRQAVYHFTEWSIPPRPSWRGCNP
ncbi:hypothetical protein EVAR_65948_1 [Eumeta japonica]|uniref:Uncharacterized protein n=1 Tax=Eumeta variegata TaxID=151549 RepID=A0A4C1ZL71_EUMVA|nr:hypothetical protein EVAR_65948_1 [Eumeta japonica]